MQSLVPMMENQFVASFTPAQMDDLSKPLNEALIKERPGPGGKPLKYITGKTAIDTANRVFGVGKWGYRVLSLTREMAGEQAFYAADIELYVLGCPFPFPGQGEGVPQRDTADQYAKARKEAVTDALKRALRHFGDQFGLCLCDDESLVEDGNGDLVPVRDIHPQQNGHKPPKRTVEAKPPLADIPTASQLRAECERIFGADMWERVKERMFKRAISDEELTPEMCARFSKALADHAARGANGK